MPCPNVPSFPSCKAQLAPFYHAEYPKDTKHRRIPFANFFLSPGDDPLSVLKF
jgi:hypothetical protein